MKFRFHKGSLEESLKTQIEVNTIEELISAIENYYSDTNQNKIVNLKFEYAGYDKRIDWNTYYVLVKLNNSSQFFVAGMSDGKMDNFNVNDY